MRAGQLRTPFRLEQPTQAVVGGKATPQYVDRGLAWGRLEGLSGATRTGITDTSGHRIVIRYRGDIKANWRLRLGTRAFEFVSPPVDPDGRREALEIVAVEVVA